MLRQLHIENFALIENLTIEFSPHLNALTGETGAGKSILIDAICFVLGERFEGIRGAGGQRPCSVEAAFELSEDFIGGGPVFETVSPEDGLLVLRREVLSGKTRCWINHRLVTLSVLKEIGNRLVDIHGQYDHQLLLDGSSHLDLIDRLAGTAPLCGDYAAVYENYRGLMDQRGELLRLEEGKERELDLLKFQIDEIDRAELEDVNEEELVQERSRLANAEKLSEAVARALGLLDEGDGAASSSIAEAARNLASLMKFDSSLEETRRSFDDIALNLEEVICTLRDYRENLTFDPGRFGEVEKKLDLLEHMKRKYGGSLEKVLEFYRQAKEKFEMLSDSEVFLRDIDKKIKAFEPKLGELAGELTVKRRKAGAALKKTIESELADLNIPHAEFETQIEPAEFTAQGRDRLEFLIRLNPGQPLMPLKKIISGGEASRVMLALKKALIQVDPVPTLIFDEIDTNIGGRLGQVTGEKLKNISRERQVLLVTHLPQIASFADRHLKVTKSVQKGKTSVKYEIMEGEERVRELAQMMSGKRETEISKKHAEEMLSRAT
jgi:DNA repair protein RecN (Recombination protein N)